MKLLIDIVMKRIYLFNIVTLDCIKENSISGLQKGKFRQPSSAPEARKERSCKSYSASHILNEEWSARFTAQPLSALILRLRRRKGENRYRTRK